MTVDSRPVWWRFADGNPPTEWQIAFETLTGEERADEWGLAAAIFIARTRRRTGRGPSFAELLRELLPEDSELFPRWPVELNAAARVQTWYAFRHHAAVEWKRRGWINWDTNVERSLRTGRQFRARSRQHQGHG